MSRRRCPAPLALLLAVILPGVPIARAFAVACGHCPRSCPMHRAAGKPGCHGGHAAGHPGCPKAGSGIAVPGCGPHADAHALSLPPAILPTPVRSWPVDVCRPLSPPLRAAPARGADPPETPPPVVSL